MERKLGVRQIAFVMLLFLIVQFAGLLLTVLSHPVLNLYVVTENAQSQANVASFIFTITIELVIIVLIFMLVLRYYKGNAFFVILEAYTVIFGSFFFFLIALNEIFPTINIVQIATFTFTSWNVVPLLVFSLVISFALLFYKRRTNKLRNTLTVISSIGAGIFIGAGIGLNFGFLVLYLLVAFIAIYDYIAVFRLKFMIPLANEAIKRNLALLIGSSDMEFLPPGSAGKNAAPIKKEELSKIKDSEIKSLIEKGNVPIVSSMALGGGDLIVPLTLSAGAYVIYANTFLSMMIILGSTAGLLANVALLRRYKVGLPAIPMIFAFESIALLIFTFVSTPFSLIQTGVFLIASALSILAMLLTLQRMRRLQRAAVSGVRAGKA